MKYLQYASRSIHVALRSKLFSVVAYTDFDFTSSLLR